MASFIDVRLSKSSQLSNGHLARPFYNKEIFSFCIKRSSVAVSGYQMVRLSDIRFRLKLSIR
jgi:hypothetical protein